MRIAVVAGLSVVGMIISGAAVWRMTPPDGGIGAWIRPEVVPSSTPSSPPPHVFRLPGTILAEGRLGHAELPAGVAADTFAYLELRPEPGRAARIQAPLNLAIVIDRSGSMRGKRLENAVAAAQGSIARLRDGDVVSVVTYNTTTEAVVPATRVSAAVRDDLGRKLRTIVAGRDTCISCGLEAGREQLARYHGMVNRLLLLSDGEATAGVRTVDGFRRIAAALGEQSISVTSIGVDVEYNERVMSTLALESNGRHYFVENAAALPRIFDQEVAALTRTVAVDAELRFDPGPGVEVVTVHDRAHRREGRAVLVPLGTFAAEDEKTLLARLRVPAGLAGTRPVGDFTLRYRDLTDGSQVTQQGTLGIAVKDGLSAPGELDPAVELRRSRSEARRALEEANQLYQAGRVEEARAKVRGQAEATRAAAAKAPAAAPKAAGEYARQAEALERADDGFGAGATGARRAGESQVRSNADWSAEAAH